MVIFLRSNRAISVVTESCGLVTGVGIAACTGVCSETALGTSRIGYSSLMIVPLCSNGITYIAIVTNGTGVCGVASFCTCRSGYIRCIIMSTGCNGELVSSDGTVGILNSGVILYLNISAVLGEVKHCYHALVFLGMLSIHSLRIYKYLSNLVAVVTGLLGNDNIIGIRMTADYHRDVGMLA